ILLIVCPGNEKEAQGMSLRFFVNQAGIARVGTLAYARVCGYQIAQRSFSGRTIGSPSLHWNAAANCGRFESGPLTRNLFSGCGSWRAIRRAISGRMLTAQPRA